MKKVLLLIAAALFLLLLAACSRTDKAGADSVQTNAAPTAEPATALTEPAPEMTEAVSAAPEPETVPPEETSPTVPETTEPAADQSGDGSLIDQKNQSHHRPLIDEKMGTRGTVLCVGHRLTNSNARESFDSPGQTPSFFIS